MFRSTMRVIPALAGNRQSTRGMATIKERLNSIDVQKYTQSFKRVAVPELRPPTPAEIPRAIRDLVKIFRERNWRNLTVREAWLNTLVTTEVICWFFVGEVIGKGTLIGYQV